MKYFLLLSIIFISCTQNKRQADKLKSTPGVVENNTSLVACNYDRNKARAKQLFEEKEKLADIESEENLIQYVADTLFNCWYGTQWDFNGTTTIPQQGKIACGYFVTTVLQDAGLKIQRTKLAQCASQVIIKKTCSDISVSSDAKIDDFVNAVKKKGPGLFIAGLDSHTGFIYNDGKEVYFIHANYAGTKCVTKERALTSPVLYSSRYRMVGKINWKN